MGGTAVTVLAKGLLTRGHRVVLFSLDPELTEEVFLDGPRLRICMGPYRPSPRRRASDLFRVERDHIHKSIEREKPDIVHAHWTYEFALGALASEASTLVTVRDWAPAVLRYYPNFYRFSRFLMNWLTFRRARHLSANSAYIQEKIRKRWGRRVPVIPNPVDDTFVRGDEKPFPTEGPIIISINNGIGRLKNVQSLMRAFRRIRKENPDYRLKLVGNDFEPAGRAEKWAKDKGLNDGIDYIGPLNREDLIRTLDEAALLIHSSLEESFGNVLVEAMARRVPVLGGKDSGAVPWLLDGGRAGALCEVRDPENIASEAIRILTSPERWRKLSQTGYRRVLDTFCLPKVVDLCLAEYERILAEDKSRMDESTSRTK